MTLFYFSVILFQNIFIVNCLSCYACQFNYKDLYDAANQDIWCTNKSLIINNKDDTIKPCGSKEIFCIVSLAMFLL